MQRSHVVRVEEQNLAALNTQADALILDEEDWEDAVNDSGVDCDMLCHSQWRSSMDFSAE
jgi:hypothetical protein